MTRTRRVVANCEPISIDSVKPHTNRSNDWRRGHQERRFEKLVAKNSGYSGEDASPTQSKKLLYDAGRVAVNDIFSKNSNPDKA
jgi:hypothetical protein